MPVVFRSGGLRFYFYSDEGMPREAPHIHVRQAGSAGSPVAYNHGFSARELRDLRRLVEANREGIETAWNEFFAEANRGPV